MKKVRSFGHKRVTMLICKGGEAVGMILWYPAAKCLCYDGKYWNTPELMDFVRPYLDKKMFYMAWKIDKLLTNQAELIRDRSKK
jgi:hypothetical protein